MRYIIVIFLPMLLAILWYRLEIWNLNASDKQTLMKSCSNYGDNRFCNCFIEALNKEMPAKEEIALFKYKGKMPQFELDAAKKCI